MAARHRAVRDPHPGEHIATETFGEPEPFAGAPARGINGQPVEFEYVRLA